MVSASLERTTGLMIMACVTLAGCVEAPDNRTNAVSEERAGPLPVPVVEAPLDRAALLLAVVEAASAAALGSEDAEQQRTLDGKRFELRIRFGCRGSQPEGGADGPFSVRFDEKARTLRVRAAPTLSLRDPLVALLADAPAKPESEGGAPARAADEEILEAVEGFWLHRPWLLSDGCPASAGPPAEDGGRADQEGGAAPVPDPVTAPSPQIGVASFFTEADARTARRDQRAYEATKVLGPDEQPSAQGYNLVLSGRLRRASNGKVISCGAATAERAPDCIVSTLFDRVWIERADSKAVLAEWAS